ncbi:hypothetical protein [Microbacterium sp. NPDC077486]|uniref:hypothetical protein n=1 Tax=Microbacterium sp. NPDC077486 TaxID=3154766 RepID=UPI00342DA906
MTTIDLPLAQAGARFPTALWNDSADHDELRSFVQSFSAPDGLGAFDFPSFMEARRSSQ